MAVSNTYTYETSFEDVLQDRLDAPTTWKELTDVTITDTRVISTSRLANPSVTTVTRGTGLVLTALTENAETMTINTGRDLGVYVDLADLAQSPWTKPAELFDRIGAILNEFIETDWLSQHASWTNIGDVGGGAVGLGSTTLTVSASNIDDIIRGVKREIRRANGGMMMSMRGVGFDWRAQDFEFLEAFTQANGYMTADKFLKDGTLEGLRYLGADHYWTNNNAANHIFAGVKKTQRLGILRGTYGQAHVINFPAADNADTNGTFLSGKAFYSRVDIGHLTPTAHATIVYDVNVA